MDNLFLKKKSRSNSSVWGVFCIHLFASTASNECDAKQYAVLSFDSIQFQGIDNFSLFLGFFCIHLFASTASNLRDAINNSPF